MSEMSEAILNSKVSLPNKLLQDDGSITDIAGKIILESVPEYDAKASLPNKFLNADGTYSTLNEIFAEVADFDLFVIVVELPEIGDPTKIYLVPNGEGTFDEYHYDDTLNKWDPFGVLDVSNLATKEEVTQCLTNATIYARTQAANAESNAKQYTDTQIENFVPIRAMDSYTSLVREGTTVQLFQSIQALNLPVGSMLMGICKLTDIDSIATGMKQEEIKIEVYNNNVIHGTMTSTNVPPYEWFIQFASESDFWRSAVTVDTVQDMIDESVTNTLGGEY